MTAQVPLPEAPPVPNSTPPPPESPPPLPEPTSTLTEAARELGGEITPLVTGIPYAWNIGDAPYSFYTVVYRVFNGGTQWVGVTARGIDPDTAFNDFEYLMKLCADHNWEPPSVTQPATSAPPTAPGNQAYNTPAPPASPASPPHDPGVMDRGTGDLHSITIEIDPKGGNNRTKFMVGRLQYPLTDARDPETVAGLFDTTLGWTPEHFRSPASYDLRGKGYKADWIKKMKGDKTYYDIVRIHH